MYFIVTNIIFLPNKKTRQGRDRGRQRMTYLGWLSRVTDRTTIAIIRKYVERQEYLIVAVVTLRHGTYID